MICGVCHTKFNNSNHFPYFLVDCGDTICLQCYNSLIQKSNNECPLCKSIMLTQPMENKAILNNINNYSANDTVPINEKVLLNGKYKLIKRLGSGNFGTVYKVKDNQNIHKDYALKVVDGNILLKGNLNYSNESFILLKLNHEFVLKCYETFYHENLFCILTEYCKGGDLEKKISEKIRDKTKFRQGEIFKWTEQMIKGIDYLHNNEQIIHRDIKPDNILLVNYDNIKICDLGVARTFSTLSIQEISTFVGTRAYMSPEMLEGKKYSYETDIWSFGCVLYELLTLEKFVDREKHKGAINNLKKMFNNNIFELRNCNEIFKTILKAAIVENKTKRENSKGILNLIKNYEYKNLLKNLTGHSDMVKSLIVLENGYVCSGSYDKTIKIWNPIEGKLIHTLDKHTGPITCLLAIKSDYLSSGSYDGTIKIWDGVEGKLIHTLNGHSKSVLCLALLNNNYLCSGSEDKNIKIWDTIEEKLIHNLSGHLDSVLCLSVLNDNYLCSGSRDTTIKIWNLTEGILIHSLEGHSNIVNSLVILDNELLCSGSIDSSIKIWKPLDGKLIHTLTEHNSVLCLLLLKNGYLCSGSDDQTIKIWDPIDGKLIHTLNDHSHYVNCLTELKNGYLCSGSFDNTIKIWDPIDGKLIYTLVGHHNVVNCLKVLNDGYLCSGSFDNSINIWDPSF